MAVGRNKDKAGKFSPWIISGNFRARFCLQVLARDSEVFSSWGNQQDLCTVNIILNSKQSLFRKRQMMPEPGRSEGFSEQKRNIWRNIAKTNKSWLKWRHGNIKNTWPRGPGEWWLCTEGLLGCSLGGWVFNSPSGAHNTFWALSRWLMWGWNAVLSFSSMKHVPYNTEYFTPYNQQPKGKPPRPEWKRIYYNRIKVVHILHIKMLSFYSSWYHF